VRDAKEMRHNDTINVIHRTSERHSHMQHCCHYYGCLIVQRLAPLKKTN